MLDEYLQSLVKQCLDQIEAVRKAYGTACPYCGAFSMGVLPDETVCNFCESYFQKSKVSADGTKNMATLNAEAIKGETKAIDSFADETKSKAPNPLVFYGIGTLYWAASSSKYAGLNYALEDFMEQNSDNIRASLDLASKSKEYFYKALDVIQHVDHAEDITSLVYTDILCNIKLGRMFQAHGALEQLNKIQTGGLARSYANMAYAVNAKSPDSIQFIRPLLNAGEPGAAYYAARMLAQKKEFDDAITILEALSTSINMPMSGYLLRSIKGFKEKTAL